MLDTKHFGRDFVLKPLGKLGAPFESISLIDPNVLILACHERAFFASRMVEVGGIDLFL